MKEKWIWCEFHTWIPLYSNSGELPAGVLAQAQLLFYKPQRVDEHLFLASSQESSNRMCRSEDYIEKLNGLCS